MKNADMPAAPTIYADMGHNGQREIFSDNQGLTKREHFAGLAMQGLLPMAHNGDHDRSKVIAKMAVSCADALLSELEKSE